MDDTTRLILANQYRILATLEKNKDDQETWKDHVEVFERGFESEMDQIVRDAAGSFLSRDGCHLVHNVLSMYAQIEQSIEAVTGAEQDVASLPWLKFSGFDGNNESEFIGFTRYLLQKRKLYGWTEFAANSDFDSHMPTMDKYKRMLNLRKSFGTHGELTAEQLRQLAAA